MRRQQLKGLRPLKKAVDQAEKDGDPMKTVRVDNPPLKLLDPVPKQVESPIMGSLIHLTRVDQQTARDIMDRINLSKISHQF